MGLYRIVLILLSLLIALPAQADAPKPSPEGRVRVKYWEKWTDFEKRAMESVVADFNASQNKIWVDYLSISGVNQKTLIATAGGDPPDLAGLWSFDIIDFADKNALTPLDDMVRGTHINEQHFLPIYWEMGTYKNHVWSVVSVPVVTSLHWNKELFEKAGLDPDRPPKTLAELDEFSKKLTVVNNGKIEQMGFVPTEPGWWPYGWGYFFGGSLLDPTGEKILIDSPEQIRAFTWLQSYAKTYGVAALQNLASSFGNFASAQNPFMTGKLAMVLQGVWMGNFIEKFGPGMRWGAAPFPSEKPGGPPITIADADMLVIPRGAKHVKEAFEFIKYVTQQGPAEKLALGHRKNSALRNVSEEFFAKHKNPYIRMFQDLAKSPGAKSQPKMPIFRAYSNEVTNAQQRVWLLEATPAQALGDVKKVIQKTWDQELRRQRTRESAQPSVLLEVAPWIMILGLVGTIIFFARREHLRSSALIGGGKSSRSNVSLWKGLAFFSPWGIGMLVFVAFPVMAAIVYSFCDYSVLSAPRFIGLENYVELFNDEVFWISLRNTLVYAAFALPLGLIVAFFFALLLDANVRGSNVYRTLIFLPSLTPLVATTMVWLWIFNGQYGVLNFILNKLTFGAFDGVAWLSDRTYAMPSLIMMSAWGVGNTVVIMLAAMQDVPTSIYEAADIDGANWWHKVRHITVPMISPVIYFNAVIGIIGALQVFAQPYIMTGGGPARATLFYAMRLYENAFTFLRMGYACAMAWILFLIILALTAIANRVSKSTVHYTGA